MKRLRSELEGLMRGEILDDEPMSAHTSLKIGGKVDLMVFPEDIVSLKNVICIADREKVPVFIVGGGTNLLVGDKGIKGIAISLRAFSSIKSVKGSDDNSVTLFVEAGVQLGSLINFLKKKGYSGMEDLVGIPGSFGGAVYMNAGSFGTEIKDVIVSVAVMNREGRILIMAKDKMKFSYRSSNIPDDLIILSANVLLKSDDPEAVKGRVRELLRRKSVTQPLGEASAGCVFKNPEGDSAGRLIRSVQYMQITLLIKEAPPAEILSD
jgi:UDP-N-acetylmuramate dehydrogenase